MNNPLDRKMFRQAGMSKQPMGILASSPELMNATKGYKDGGIQIPFYGQRKPQSKYNIGSIDDNLQLIQNEALKTDFEDAFGPKKTIPKNFSVEPNVVVPPKSKVINDTNKKIIDQSKDGDKDNLFGVKKLRPSFPGKKDSDTTTTESDVSADTLYGGVSQKIEDEAKLIKNAYDKFNNNTADLKDAEFLGTTYNKEVAKQLELLQKEGKEFSIADAKKVAKDMGFSDPEELDEQYGEDREASFWLNMMKAGAAMAAGGSSNTLTNFAKGFTVGLEGYGKDTGELRKELRADKKEASKTIYSLLKDGKSEDLAKKALDLQKSAAITNILKTEVGEERTRLTNEVNNEVANRKLTISLFKTFADMNFEAKKFNVGREDVEAASNIAYAKMIPDDLKLLIASGEVKIIDNSRPDLLAPDNIKASPKGIKSIQLLLSNLKSGKITDTQVAIGTAGSVGKTNSGIVFDTGSENYNPNISGTAIKEYNKLRSELINSIGAENKQIAQQDVQFAKVNGGKIDLNLQTDKMLSIFTDQSKGQSFVDRNQNIFIPLKST